MLTYQRMKYLREIKRIYYDTKIQPVNVRTVCSNKQIYDQVYDTVLDKGRRVLM